MYLSKIYSKNGPNISISKNIIFIQQFNSNVLLCKFIGQYSVKFEHKYQSIVRDALYFPQGVALYKCKMI